MTAEWRRGAGYAAALTVALGALAGVVARMTVLVPMDRTYSTIEARLGGTLVVVLLLAAGLTLLAALTVVPVYGLVSDRVGTREVPWLVLLALGAVVCFAGGFVGVQPVAGGFAEATVDTYGGFGGPFASFEAEREAVGEDEYRLTITHTGGDPLPADRLSVRGEGFADVEGADHVGPGAWQGEVSGARPRRGGAAVVEGDSVTVGVTDDCRVRVVYEGEDQSATVGAHDCQRPRP